VSYHEYACPFEDDMPRAFMALVSALTLGAVWTAAQQAPQFRAGNNTVSIYATVIDGDGRLVPDLTRDDFEVFDNGVRQDLTVFSSAPQPIGIVVMLDRSESVERFRSIVRDAAQAFVKQLTPGDRARVGSFGSRIVIRPDSFIGDRAELSRILDEELPTGGATPLWTATALAMDALAPLEGRRVVLVFTDGHDNPASGDPFTAFSTVSQRAQVEEIMVYGIGLAQACDAPSTTNRSAVGASWGAPAGALAFQGRGRSGRQGGRRPPIRIPGLPPILAPPRGMPPRPPLPGPIPPSTPPSGGTLYVPCVATQPDPHLRQLTDLGGGGYFELKRTGDLQATFARVADELRRQYLLAFTAATLDGGMHRLEVRVKDASLQVRARHSYLAK
jgi:VWFA-related protein